MPRDSKKEQPKGVERVQKTARKSNLKVLKEAKR